MSNKQSARSVSIDSVAVSAHHEDGSAGAGGGLPQRIARLCGNHVGEAVEVLVDLMHNSDRDGVRLGAAKAVLDAARELATEGEQQPTVPPVVVVLRDAPKELPPGAQVIDMATLDAEAEAEFRAGQG